MRDFYKLAFILIIAAGAAALLSHHRTKRAQSEGMADAATLLRIQNARAQSEANGRFLMVEFEADWCVDCFVLSRMLQEESTRREMADHFDVVGVDVGEFDRNVDVARALGIDMNQGIPAAVFFAPDGIQSSRRVGVNPILQYLAEAAHPLLAQPRSSN